MSTIPNPRADVWLLIDGQPGRIVRLYDDADDRGYDILMENGDERFMSHGGSRSRILPLYRCTTCGVVLDNSVCKMARPMLRPSMGSGCAMCWAICEAFDL